MEFSIALCGFHYYKKYWTPVESECLDWAHDVPKRWENCWLSSNENLLTN